MPHFALEHERARRSQEPENWLICVQTSGVNDRRTWDYFWLIPRLDASTAELHSFTRL